MANKEFRDYNAGTGDPNDVDLVLLQPQPTGTPTQRKYTKWTWLQLKTSIKNYVMTFVTWENISGSPDDNPDLEAKFVAKQNTLVSGTNIKTVNSNSLLGSGNISVQDTLTDANFGSFANGLTAKSTPIDADSINITDSADSNKQKKTTLTQFKAYLKTYFDTIYSGVVLATSSVAGIMKLYTSTGSNTDGTMDQNSITTALSSKEAMANKDTNGGYVGRDSSGGASVVDVTVSSTTASTLAFISSGKKLISATGALLGTWFQTLTAKSTPIDADTIIVNDSASSFESKKVTLLQAWTNYYKAKADAIYQAVNTNLTAISGITTSADKLIYWTGSGLANITNFTSFGRSLVDDADAQTARVTLGVTVPFSFGQLFTNGVGGGNQTAFANVRQASPIQGYNRAITKFGVNVTTLNSNPTKMSAAIIEIDPVTFAETIVTQDSGEISITATGIVFINFPSTILSSGKIYAVIYVFDQSITLQRNTTSYLPAIFGNTSVVNGSWNGGYTTAFTYATTLVAGTWVSGGTCQIQVYWDN